MCGLVLGLVATPTSIVVSLDVRRLVWKGGRGRTTAAALDLRLLEIGAAAATDASRHCRNGAAASLSLGPLERIHARGLTANAVTRFRGIGMDMRSHGHGRRRGSICPAWASWATASLLPEAASEKVNRVTTLGFGLVLPPIKLRVPHTKFVGAAMRLGAWELRGLPLVKWTPSALAVTELEFEGSQICLGRRAGLPPAAAAWRRRDLERMGLAPPTSLAMRGRGRNRGSTRATRTWSPRSTTTLRGWPRGMQQATVLRKALHEIAWRHSGGGSGRRRRWRAPRLAAVGRLLKADAKPLKLQAIQCPKRVLDARRRAQWGQLKSKKSNWRAVRSMEFRWQQLVRQEVASYLAPKGAESLGGARLRRRRATSPL